MTRPTSGGDPRDPRRAQRREGWTVPIDRVAAFISGAPIAVEPDQIEAELARFWQRAGERSRSEAGRLIVNRATLWNLVVTVRGEPAFQAHKTLLDEVAESLAARIIVLYTHREPAPTDSSQSGDYIPFGDDVPVRAFIEANLRDSGAVREILGEEITLEAPQLESRRLPGLTRGLLLPDLPTALFLDGPPPATLLAQRSLAELPLLADADRLILDSGKLAEADDLRRLAQALPAPGAPLPGGGQAPRELADLGWLRLSGWRTLLASLFDPPEAAAALRNLDEIDLQHGPLGAPAAYLLAGWLVDRLGLSLPPGASEGDLRDATGRSVRLRVRVCPSADTGAVAAVTLRSGDRTFVAVGQTDTRCVELLAPDAPRRLQPLHGRPDAELLIAALHAPGRDPLFYRALRAAEGLVQAAAPAPKAS